MLVYFSLMDNAMLKRLEVTKERLVEIDNELSDEKVISDIKRFKELSKERSSLEPIVDAYNEYLRVDNDLKDAEIMMGDSDPEIALLGQEEHKNLLEKKEKLISNIQIMLLPKDPNDDKNIVVEIRGAAGGDEANIFAGDLFRMYVRYAEHQNWKIQMIEENISEAGGFASV